MKSKIYQTILLAVGLSLLPMSASADDPGFKGKPSSIQKEGKIHGHEDNDYGLSDYWGSARKDLAEQGVTFEMIYTGEIVSNFNPGLVSNKKETMYLDNLDITLTVDTEKAGLWDGGTLFIYGLRNTGRDPSGNVIGDLQGASNIEAPNRHKPIIYEAWFEQQFFDTFSILFGFHDLNSEFYVSEYSSLFLNSSPGIGAEVAGNVPVSIFAQTGLALRVHVDPTDNWYVQAAAYDGDPATRGLKTSEGKMYIMESGVSFAKGTYKAGYWQHTADVVFNGQTFNKNYGYYGIIDQRLFDLAEDQNISAFIRWGTVPANRNAILSHTEFGLHMHGLIPSRAEDDLGIAYIQAKTNIGSEVVYEFTYRASITPWLAIQPSFQMIQNPSGDPANRTINVGLLRFEIAM